MQFPPITYNALLWKELNRVLPIRILAIFAIILSRIFENIQKKKTMCTCNIWFLWQCYSKGPKICLKFFQNYAMKHLQGILPIAEWQQLGAYLRNFELYYVLPPKLQKSRLRIVRAQSIRVNSNGKLVINLWRSINECRWRPATQEQAPWHTHWMDICSKLIMLSKNGISCLSIQQ